MRVTLLRRLDPWLPPLALMGVIFLFSAQPDLNSGLGTADTVLRKCVHFAEYALLCFLWWRVFRAGSSPRRAALLALLTTSAYAVTDEWHQSYVSGRHASPLDWAIDTAGATVVAARLAARARAHR
jgi:VanZ family protein